VAGWQVLLLLLLLLVGQVLELQVAAVGWLWSCTGTLHVGVIRVRLNKRWCVHAQRSGRPAKYN
jgi:hypothetical protein